MKVNKLTQALSLSLAIAGQAHSAEFVVMTTGDESGGSATEIAANVYQVNSLRSALELANDENTFPGLDTIRFDASVFASSSQEILLENGELLVTSEVNIEGPGADLLTLNANQQSRLMTIDDGTATDHNVSIAGITFTGGNGVSEQAVNLENNRGGCIFTKEPLQLKKTVVTECQSSVDGGGLGSLNAEISISESVISQNRTAFKGGGVKSQGGELVITQSSITGNRANRSIYAGGGIQVTSTPLHITNSTISGNHARAGATGGISIYFNTDLTVLNSTVVNNSGGGIHTRRASHVNIKNSIIANNADGDCDLSQVSDNSVIIFNLDTDGSCDVFGNNHITVEDPMLEPLANFGGFTPTHRPLPGSPVIDSGGNQVCSAQDQRGVPRPQDGDNDFKPDCDIGAVEYTLCEVVPKEVIFSDGFEDFSEQSLSQEISFRGCR